MVVHLKQNNVFTTYLALTGAMIFWGLSFVATKMALESFTTFTLVFARFSIAACFFLVLMIWRGVPSFTGKAQVKLFLVALFEPGLYFIFETIGLQYTSAPKAALIIATIPIVVLISASLFLGERTSLIKLAGIFTSFAGITVLIAGDPKFNLELGGPLIGDLLIFGAVLSAAFYIVFARDLGQDYSALEITSIQVIFGALFYAPAFFWELPKMRWEAVTGSSVGALIYLTIFATIAAFLCYNHALTKISASRASLFINGIPVVTAVGAWILLDERLTLMQTGGGMLVLLAVYVTNLPGLQPRFQEI